MEELLKRVKRRRSLKSSQSGREEARRNEKYHGHDGAEHCDTLRVIELELQKMTTIKLTHKLYESKINPIPLTKQKVRHGLNSYVVGEKSSSATSSVSFPGSFSETDTLRSSSTGIKFHFTGLAHPPFTVSLTHPFHFNFMNFVCILKHVYLQVIS